MVSMPHLHLCAVQVSYSTTELLTQSLLHRLLQRPLTPLLPRGLERRLAQLLPHHRQRLRVEVHDINFHHRIERFDRGLHRTQHLRGESWVASM